jgi:hypothetical protein
LSEKIIAHGIMNATPITIANKINTFIDQTPL